MGARADQALDAGLDIERSVLEGLDVGVVVLDGEGCVVLWQGWMARAARIPVKAAIGRAFLEIFPALRGTRLEAAIEDARRLGAASLLTHALNPKLLPLLRSDSRPMLHSVTVRPLPGREAHTLLQVTDVTAAADRERALRQRQQAMFQAVVDTAADPIVTTGPDGRIAWANRAAARHFGAQGGSLVERPLASLLGEAAAERWIRPAGRAHEPQRFEVEASLPDGSEACFDIAVAHWTSGERSFATGVLRDVTAHRAAERMVRDNEERLRLALSAARMFFWDWNLRTGEVTWSEGLEQACRLPPGGFEGSVLAFLGLVHADDRPRVEAALAAALSGEANYDIEFRMVRGDGAPRWVVARATVLRDSAGQPLRMVGIDLDVTERKELERALALANTDLETRVAERTRQLLETAQNLAVEMRRREAAQAALVQAQKLEALGQLTGGVAHDFNNVLAAVLGSYRLIRRLDPRTPVLELLRHGEMAAERAATLVRRLLAFARREEVRPQQVNAADVLAQVALLAQHTLGGRWQCRVEPADDIWPVLVDPHLLEVALLNLLVNARDAMPTGGVVTIAASNLPEGEGDIFGWLGGEAVVFRVQDAGEGMSPEVLVRIGEPFFTTKAVGQGTGLGLAMVRSFVEQSSGRLHFTSSLGEGTTVSIVLPKVPAAVANADGAPPERQSAVHRGNGEAILLVDDDSQVRAIAAAQLRDLGYTVLEAGDAESAFSLSKAASVLDLLICDVVMPGVNGPALAMQMGRERPRLPVLFISGFADAVELPEGADLLRKPFRMEEMAEKIGNLLRSRAARR